MSSELPFEAASEAFQRCTGDRLSADHMFEADSRIAGRFDVLDICPTREEIEHKVEELSTGEDRKVENDWPHSRPARYFMRNCQKGK